jgi:hypothetical protein
MDSSSFSFELVRRLKELRLARKLTQKKLSEDPPLGCFVGEIMGS